MRAPASLFVFSLVLSGIIEKFIELAGGKDRKFVVVPTARGNFNLDGSPRRFEEPQVLGNLLGLGISENTAVVVHGDKFEVIGTGRVAVHDNTRKYEPGAKPYLILMPCDIYDMKLRALLNR